MKKRKNKKNSIDLQKIFKVIEKIIDHKSFRPIAIAILTSFLLFNGSLYVKNFIADYKEKKLQSEKNALITIQLTEKGKILDFDQVQIVERKVGAGDNILNFLFDIGTSEADSFAILSALKKVYDPRKMVVGNSMIAKFKVKLKYGEGKNRLQDVKKDVFVNEFKIIVSNEIEYVVRNLGDNNFQAKEIKHELVKKIIRYVGEINDGLFIDATAVGASPNAVMNMINLYGYSIDFQRDIKKGDEFEILVERYFTESGRRVRDGNILFASLKSRGKKIEFYSFVTKNGAMQYYDENGSNIKRSLLRTPVNGARISSRFGYRKHPILGYSKLHKGVDFAAPRGTPIFAAGDGVIIYRGRNGGYGNFIKIRHNSTYQTAYAHISRFNSRFRRGSRVRQGDVIAYVGTTGRSTGPHLHFEVLQKGRAINPANVKAVSSNRLTGKDLSRFKEGKIEIDKLRKNSQTNI